MLKDATQRLADVSDSARLDAEILLAAAPSTSPRSYLFAHPEDSNSTKLAIERLEALARAPARAGEPMAYIHRH